VRTMGLEHSSRRKSGALFDSTPLSPPVQPQSVALLPPAICVHRSLSRPTFVRIANQLQACHAPTLDGRQIQRSPSALLGLIVGSS
jgi:hypothetical protein